MTTSIHNHLVPMMVDVQRCVDRAVDELDSADNLQTAVRTLIALAPPEPAMLAVPLLVHEAETGRAEPAVPVAAAHYLWWVAAHVFDDVIDHASTSYSGLITAEESVMAAVVVGSALPTQVLVAGLDSPDADQLVTEFSWAWIHSNEGQLLDIAGKPGSASFQDVLHTYRRKNGAAYGMACALAARVAGTDQAQVDRWREFGVLLGLLGQFRNDQEDVANGRHEDLKNQTATYLLTHLLASAEPRDGRERLAELVDAAPSSETAREQLYRHMIDEEHVAGYLSQVAKLRAEVHALLDATDRTGPPVEALREIVDEAAEPVGPFATNGATAAPAPARDREMQARPGQRA